MKNEIVKVYKGSIAEELKIEVGDKLLTINGTDVEDIIDYKFLMADEYVEIEIEKPDGEVWELEIEKEYQEDLGVEFKSAILDNARSCSNNCMFCFIDQLPKGMRETLYFKDDDSRLSFLQGNFVTFTNMKDKDIDRIIKYRISPINVSVHTTNPELRKKMLNNKFAGNIYEILTKLSKAGIMINCQIVSCPGVNNGEDLKKTIEDLYKLYPAVQNVAVVPVGITKHRINLNELKAYDNESAKNEIELLKPLQEKYISDIGEPFVRLSDEFYVLSGIEVPDEDFYGAYEQIEDGVGMIRMFRENISRDLSHLKRNIAGSFTMATGVSAYSEILEASKNIERENKNININVYKIINKFFGETITVAGLLTGQDIIKQLKDKDLGEYIILPVNMLKSGEKVFLDDVTVEDIEKELDRKILICEYTGEDLIDIINKFGTEV